MGRICNPGPPGKELVCMNRAVLVLMLLAMLTSGSAVANDLLLAPTGVTLTTGQDRAEAALNDNGKYFWLGTGFKAYELNVVHIDSNPDGNENLIGAQWNFIPETIFAPAVAFGVRDAASESKEGIGAYFAITRHLPLPERSILEDFGLTFGLGAVGIRGPFFGFQAELARHFLAEGEYDSQNFNAAVGWEAMPNFKIKAYIIRGEAYFGAQLERMDF